MPDATAVDIAKGVVTELNAETFTTDFTATRFYLPIKTLEDMTNLVVFVASGGAADQIHERNATLGTYEVRVTVQQQVDPSVLAPIDTLLKLVEDIADFFRLRPMTEVTTALWDSVEHAPLYDRDLLLEQSLFLSVITLTFTVVRSQ